MKKLIKKTLFLAFAVFMLGFPVLAVAENGLEIDPSDDPLFDVENFFPGRSVSADVTVINNFNEKGEISVKTQDIVENKGGFAEFLELSVRRDGGELCLATVEDLSKENKNCKLGELDGESSEDFEFIITFLHGSGNNYQDEEIEFDFLFSFLGEKGEEDTETVPGVGGGVTDEDEEDAVLEIFGEDEEMVTREGATITWNTNIPATSKVIYGLSSNMFNYNEGPPAYGYDFYKEGDDSGEGKVTFHQVTLTGLLSGTTYYYRVVSYASPPSISRQYSFTTAEIAGEFDEKSPFVTENDFEPELKPELEVARAFDIKEECEYAGFYWYDDVCHLDPKEEILLEKEVVESLEEEKAKEDPFFQKFLAALNIKKINDWRIFLSLFTTLLLAFIIFNRRRKE